MEDNTADRLSNLERRVADQNLRLQALESRFRPATEAKIPQVQTVWPAPEPYVRTRNVDQPEGDTEYEIGAKLLPKLGAAVLILGFAYLVGLAVSQGRITPTMLWWGINVIAAVFVGFGQGKRTEHEQFGQILTAVGSGALYLNFAGGYEFQHLYPSELLVLMFLALSAANLLYAFWRSSKVFLGLGFMGGILASLMPLHNRDFPANAALTALVVLPAVLIAARNRWTNAIAWIGTISGIALLPLVTHPAASIDLKTAAVMGIGLAISLGYGWAFEASRFDPQSLCSGLAVFSAALVSILLRPNAMGSHWILGYAAVAGVSAALIVRNPKPRTSLVGTAVLMALWIAPFGLMKPTGREAFGPGFWILLCLSAACILGFHLRIGKLLSLAGTVQFLLALAVYCLSLKRLSLSSEIGLVIGFLILTVLAAWSLGRSWIDHRSVFEVCGSSGSWALLWRLGQLGLVQSSVGMNADAAATASWVVTAGILMSMGFVLNRTGLRWTSFVVIGVTMAKVLLVDLASLDSGTRVAVLMLLGLAMLGGGYLYIKVHGKSKSARGDEAEIM